MKKIVTTAISTVIMATSINVNAASPFNYVEYAIGTISYDSDSDNGDYSALSFAIETPIVPIFSLEFIDFNNSDILKIGIGTQFEVGNTSNLFGFVHYNDYDGDTDSDFSLTAGIRSSITDRLEAKLSLATYTDQDSLDSTKLSLGYFLTKNFSIAGNYDATEYSDIISASAKYSF